MHFIISDLQNGSNFIRKNTNRNNGNPSRLIEKYSNLAIEALSSGDKILSENYYQHAEHFIRVLGDKDAFLNKKKDSSETIKQETTEEKSEQDKNNSNGLDKKVETRISTES